MNSNYGIQPGILTVEHIGELNDLFTENQFDSLPMFIVIHGIRYKYSRSPQVSIIDMTHDNRKAFVLYRVEPEDQNMAKFEVAVSNINKEHITSPMALKDMIALVWYEKDLNILPYRTRYIDSSNLAQVLVKENHEDRPVIGNELKVKFDTLGGLVQEAKVDTGADMSSLHADNIKATGESVSFEIDGRRYNMNQAGSVDIQTADNGNEPRPIVKLTVTCDHCTVHNHEFNLNDRSDMPHKVLLGQDFLQHGNFLIDPLKESDDVLNRVLNTLIDLDDSKEIDNNEQSE